MKTVVGTEKVNTNEKYSLIYVEDPEKESNLSYGEIGFGSIRELELLKLMLGENVSDVTIQGLETRELLSTNEYKWNYRNPTEAFNIARKISMPNFVSEQLIITDQRIDKKLVHKEKQENVLLSVPINHGNVWYFKGFSEIAELNSDHPSDHVDGIKLFEALRQATLASFHLNGMNHEGVVALTNFRIDYINYVELDQPYIIQTIPVCEPDGGAMYCVFNIIQNEKVVTSGFLGAYTFRSKEIYEEKRKK
ncbi:AfsA-related hotdog domain-containing protein [Enterococcus rivorum]|uniref:A-factor biosynthesis hotdog domain-containing protein n=1 Tax=Enterococcus rivorum TaxID=762845 RepID=A0A1E5KT05_9ENTE|nr:AfsA-related hotdog domain-containing protein [Enterococcus rivorum]MBP2098070.1 hypothetical protein [Enterococcus rivorum]OEH81015.1 hypothetical protein BCR26_05740 [Enterococcus rivorum]